MKKLIITLALCLVTSVASAGPEFFPAGYEEMPTRRDFVFDSYRSLVEWTVLNGKRMRESGSRMQWFVSFMEVTSSPYMYTEFKLGPPEVEEQFFQFIIDMKRTPPLDESDVLTFVQIQIKNTKANELGEKTVSYYIVRDLNMDVIPDELVQGYRHYGKDNEIKGSFNFSEEEVKPGSDAEELWYKTLRTFLELYHTDFKHGDIPVPRAPKMREVSN